MDTKNAQPHNYTRMSAVRFVLIAKKTSTFSVKDLRKTLSQYVCRRHGSDFTNVKTIFRLNNTHPTFDVANLNRK